MGRALRSCQISQGHYRHQTRIRKNSSRPPGVQVMHASHRKGKGTARVIARADTWSRVGLRLLLDFGVVRICLAPWA